MGFIIALLFLTSISHAQPRHVVDCKLDLKKLSITAGHFADGNGGSVWDKRVSMAASVKHDSCEKNEWECIKEALHKNKLCWSEEEKKDDK